MNIDDMEKHLNDLITITDDIADLLVKLTDSAAGNSAEAQSLYKRYADWQGLYYWQLWTGEAWKVKKEEDRVND